MRDNRNSGIQNRSYLSLLLILTISLILWLTLRSPGIDADGLKSAYLIEMGDGLRSLSDHLLWQELSWATYTIGKVIYPEMRGILAEQLVNLILFCLTLFLIWKYLRLHNKNSIYPLLGIIASYASFKCLTGEDVDVGPLLLFTLILFILPVPNKQRSILVSILVLSLALVMHKSLILLTAGWWLASVVYGEDSFWQRMLRSSLMLLLAGIIALGVYYLSWATLTHEPDFLRWFFPHGENSQSFFSLNPLVVVKGIGLSSYRSFLNIIPIKLFAQGSIWGVIGLVFSGLVIMALILLVLRCLMRGKKANPVVGNDQHTIRTLLLVILPSVLFFLFWIPGYYTYWSRFLPIFWVLITFRIPSGNFNTLLNGSVIGLLALVNIGIPLATQPDEEAGIMTRWLAPKLSPGDLLILPGNGVLYFGSAAQYYYHADIMTLDVLEVMEHPEEYLEARSQEIWQKGHHIWFCSDYARWTSERILHGEQTKYAKGMKAVESVFRFGARDINTNPAMDEAWISECLPQ